MSHTSTKHMYCVFKKMQNNEHLFTANSLFHTQYACNNSVNMILFHALIFFIRAKNEDVYLLFRACMQLYSSYLLWSLHLIFFEHHHKLQKMLGKKAGIWVLWLWWWGSSFQTLPRTCLQIPFLNIRTLWNISFWDIFIAAV